jgi:hypothetical protein
VRENDTVEAPDPGSAIPWSAPKIPCYLEVKSLFFGGSILCQSPEEPVLPAFLGSDGGSAASKCLLFSLIAGNYRGEWFAVDCTHSHGTSKSPEK